MLALVVRRLLASVPVLLALTLLLFLGVKLVPGDAAVAMAGERASPEKIEAIRAALHLNDPWFVQYGLYLKRLVTELDLGDSLFHQKPISALLAVSVPATVELGAAALLIALPCGILFGIIGAAKRNRWPDRIASAGSLAGVSMPVFWLALVLVYVFSIRLDWFPTNGRMSDLAPFDPTEDSQTRMYTLDGLLIGLRSGEWEVFQIALRHIALPATALASIPMAHIARMARSAFLEILGQDFIRTARAKGLSPTAVLLRHAFRNAAPPIVTVSMLQAGTVFGGAVITESMFSWPGLGKALVESIAARDFPMIQSGTLFVGAVFVACNLGADLLHAALDPRLRGRGG